MGMRDSTHFLRELANVIVRLLSAACDSCGDLGSPQWPEKSLSTSSVFLKVRKESGELSADQQHLSH